MPFFPPFCARGRDGDDDDRDKIKAKKQLQAPKTSRKKQVANTMYSKVGYVVVVLFYSLQRALALAIVACFSMFSSFCSLRVGVILTRNKQG